MPKRSLDSNHLVDALQGALLAALPKKFTPIQRRTIVERQIRFLRKTLSGTAVYFPHSTPRERRERNARIRADWVAGVNRHEMERRYQLDRSTLSRIGRGVCGFD